ncbi:PAS domain S-box protein [Azospirillum doebereinerae]
MPDENRMEKRQHVLADFGEFALRSDDLDAVLTEACRLIANALGTGRAKVLEITDEGRTLFVRAGVGWDKGVVGRVRLPMGELSSETYAITLGGPVITNDFATEDRFDFPAFLKEAGVKALANVPILLPGGGLFGLLQVDAPEPRAFRDEDTQFLRTYATILGPVIDRLIKVQALGATEERFRTIVEAARDYAIFLTDPQNRITVWLPGAEAVFGWTAAEAIGQPSAILYTPEDQQAGVPEAEMKTAREDGSAPDVRWHLRKDGSHVFIEGSVVALWNGAGELRGFQKIGQDVTKRHLSEEALRESEGRLRTLVSTGSATLYRMSPDWRLMYQLDSQSLAITSEPIKDWADKYIPAEDRPQVHAAIEQAIRSKSLFELEHRVLLADGSIGWVLSRAVPLLDPDDGITEWFGSGSDVTERRMAVEKLRESREKYHLLFSSIDEGFCIIEMLFDENDQGIDYVFLETNPVFEQQAGFKITPGQRMREVAPEHEKFWFDIYGRIALTGEPARFEHHAASFGVFYDVYAFRVDEPKRRRVAVLFRNITERKRAEEALRESEELRRIALEGGGMGAWRLDSRDRSVRADDVVQKLLGMQASPQPHRVSTYADRMCLEGAAWLEAAMTKEIAPDEEFHGQVQVASGPTAGRWVQLRGRAERVRPWIINGVSFDITEQRLAEQKLRASEAQLAAAFESVPAGVAVIGMDGKVLLANGEYRRFLPNGIIPSRDPDHGHCWQAWDDDGRLIAQQDYPSARALRGEPVIPGQEMLYTHPDGRELWTNVATAPTRDDTGRVTGCVSVISDITERKAAEAALRRSEAHLEAELRHTTLLRDLAARLVTEESARAIYEEILSTALAIMESDAGTVQVYDPETASLVLLVAKGFPRDMLSRFHRVDAASNTACGNALRAGRRTFVDFDKDPLDEVGRVHVEADVRSAQATPLLSRDGSPIGMLNTHWRASGHRPSEAQLGFLDLLARQAADLIEQRRAEAARRESEARFRTLAQTMPQLVWTAVDGGECTWVSPRWAEFTGRPAKEMLAWGWLEVVHPDDRAQARAAWIEATARGHLEIELRLRRADGAWRWFQVRGLPVPGAAGEAQQWCGACADVTELKEAEASLRAARDAAEAANREKSRFLASVSHDLRQPVMAAILFLEVLTKSALGKAERELVDVLVLSLNSLTGMLNGLLEVARLDAGIVQVDVREFDLDDLLQRLHNEFRGLAREARLRLHMPPAPWTVRSDPLLVELILRNLISNALKFTETGGISVEVRVDGTAVDIEVSDTGVGIVPKDVERIFEEYFQAGNTARDHSRGFGIGLATVRRVAALLSTEVTVRSEPGQGSTFTLQLPLAVEPGTTAEGAEDEFGLDEPCGTLDGRIALVVDDEPLVLRSLELMLKTLGITVYAARTLADAEAILDGLDQPPDIIISDYTLARGERGTDAIASARRRGTSIAVLITGDTSAARLAEARRSGAQLLHKPIDPGVLEDLLAAAVTAL